MIEISKQQVNIPWVLLSHHGWLMSLSPIFQLYHPGQFYLGRKPENSRRKTQISNKSLTNFIT
jgi:hypothetical protein